MTTDEFIQALEPARRVEVETVRALIRKNLPAGYEEVISSNMLVYQVPFSEYSDTYNGHPLWLAALASQKTGLSLHLMPLYMNDVATTRLETQFREDGKKLNMGKACIRFKRASDLSASAIADIISGMPMSKWIDTAKWAQKKSK